MKLNDQPSAQLNIMARAVRLIRVDSGSSECAVIDYGIHSTTFGDVLVAMTAIGVCRLDFLDALPGDTWLERVRSHLQSRWPDALLQENQASTRPVISTLFAASESAGKQAVPVHIAGTDFQFDVWRSLLNIPSGKRISYSQLALASGHAGAARAVGSAVAANPVALLIPCHRVVRQDGQPGEYRWGRARKQALLAAESVC